MLTGARRVAVAAVLSAAVGSVVAAKAVPSWSAQVTQVIDGDSLWVQPTETGARPVEVRLADIDAPEICQVWGPQARDALRELTAGKTVQWRTTGRDTYGRTLAHASIDGTNLNAHLVMEGHAWSQRTRWDQGPLVKEERVARALRRGLHAQPNPQMPRDFRRQHGPCTEGSPAGAAGTAASSTSPSPPAAAPASFRCDGRIYCSQMTSCAEAKLFLRHCPGVKMDGDGDGIPCEQQWCSR